MVRSYYRLRQVDSDGPATYSSVRVVTRLAPAEAPLLAFPNSAPAAGTKAVMPLAGLPAGFYMLRCGAFSQRLTLE